jgi:hypothetical protein
VPLKVFHVWHFAVVSTVQQHAGCSSAHALCLLLHSNWVNTKCYIYVATTAQWIQQKIKCGLHRAVLSYKVSNVLKFIVLGG